MPSSLASRISSPLAVSTPNSACTAAASEEGGCGSESQDVLSPLPTSSSLSRAASAAIARSGGSALIAKKGNGKMKHAGRRGSGGNANGHNHGRGRKTSQMKVVARIRPLSAEEVERGCTETVVPIFDDCQDGKANDEQNVDVGADENAPPSSSVFHTPKIGNRRTATSEGITADNDNSPMAQQQQPASTSLLAGGGNANAANSSAASAAVPKQFD